jgi:hypothetical protein
MPRPLGFALLICLAIGLPTGTTGQEGKPVPAGRYQILMSPHNARDTFLLDTETGRVWQLTVLTFLNDDPAVWELMPRIDGPDDYNKVVNDHGRKPRLPPQSK